MCHWYWKPCKSSLLISDWMGLPHKFLWASFALILGICCFRQ
jgi:hypothetical protein